MAKTRSVAVLGGLGFLGSHICREFVRAGYTVRIFDRPGTSHHFIEDIESQIQFIAGDIAHTSDVLQAITGMDVVIHLVHTTVPSSSMSDPVFDINSNIAATVGWLQHLPSTGVKKLVYCSSGGTVYGQAQYTPIDEKHPTNPISPYGVSKLAIEKYVALFANRFNIDFVIMRPSNVYGEGQKLRVGQGVIGVMINQAKQGKPFELWGTGETIRDYLYVKDMATATKSLVEYDGSQHIFNIGTEVGYSVLQIIDLVRSTLNYPLDVVQKPAGGFAVPISVLDSSLIFNETGWQFSTNFVDGIARTIQWIDSMK